MNNNQRIKYMVLVAMFISIQIVMFLIPFLGFIPIFAIRITTLHIPTILAGILLGVKGGALVGLSFGAISVVNATVNPNLTSFLFTPFAPALSGYHGNAFSLLIAFVPRILLGVFSALIYQFIKNKDWELDLKYRGWKFGAATITGICASILHTFMVLGLIFVIFATPYASALGIDPQGVLVFLGGIVASNGIFEALLASVLMTAFVATLEPIVKKMVSD